MKNTWPDLGGIHRQASLLKGICTRVQVFVEIRIWHGSRRSFHRPMAYLRRRSLRIFLFDIVVFVSPMVPQQNYTSTANRQREFWILQILLRCEFLIDDHLLGQLFTLVTNESSFIFVSYRNEIHTANYRTRVPIVRFHSHDVCGWIKQRCAETLLTHAMNIERV